MINKNNLNPESIKHAWQRHNLEHFQYFRSLSLHSKLESVQGMADVVRRLQELRTRRKSGSTSPESRISE